MNTIFDYLKWRGDLTFDIDPVNEVDNLIFSCLAYLKCDDYVSNLFLNGGISLAQLYDKMSLIMEPIELASYYIPEKIVALLKQAANTKRFGSIKLIAYINIVNPQISKQFSAVTFVLPSDTYFIAFRGTDNSFAGWKENMYMSYKEEVEAQKHSVEYVKEAMSQLKGKFYLGGHSKGGNLAIYASTFLDLEQRSRIVGVYNNDGPGLQAKCLEREAHQSMMSRIHTFIPKSSIVGRILEHGDAYKVVESAGKVIFQHDAFLWEINGPSFVYEKELSKNSDRIDQTIRLWLANISPTQREKFIEALFEIIEGTGVYTFSALNQDKLKSLELMNEKYKCLDPEAKSVLKKTLIIMLNESRKVFQQSINNEIEHKVSLFKKSDV